MSALTGSGGGVVGAGSVAVRLIVDIVPGALTTRIITHALACAPGSAASAPYAGEDLMRPDPLGQSRSARWSPGSA
jgi:hypothetical protein